MNFLHKHKTLIYYVIIISILSDIGIGFLINILSSDKFDIAATHNIWIIVIFVILVAMLIVCKIIEFNTSTRAKTRRLQKTFQDNGGYDVVVDEMKECIKKHDFKSLKELKRMVELIEK